MASEEKCAAANKLVYHIRVPINGNRAMEFSLFSDPEMDLDRIEQTDMAAQEKLKQRKYIEALELNRRALNLAVPLIQPGVRNESTKDVFEYLDMDHRPIIRTMYTKFLILEAMGDVNGLTEHGLDIMHYVKGGFYRTRIILFKVFFQQGNLEEAEKYAPEAELDGTLEDAYSIVLLKFSKYRQQLLQEDEVIQALQVALKQNPYVPHCLFKAQRYQANESDTINNSDELKTAITYTHNWKWADIWRECEGALLWLKSMETPRQGRCPETVFWKLLNHGRILVEWTLSQSARRRKAINLKLLTRHKQKMVGSGLPSFALPDGFDDEHVSGQDTEISAFEITNGWNDNGFRSFPYSAVFKVQFWYIIEKEAQTQAEAETQARREEEEKQRSQNETATARGGGSKFLALWALLREEIMSFLVGSRAQTLVNPKVLRNVVSLTRTCKFIRESLQAAKLFNRLRLCVDVSELAQEYDSCEDEEDGLDEGFDEYGNYVYGDEFPADTRGLEGWKPLLKHSTDIIRTSIRYGGQHITELRLCLKNVRDSALQIISRSCHQLKVIDFTFAFDLGCKFFTETGLCEFFTSLDAPDLHAIGFGSFMGCDVEEDCTVTLSVFQAIAARNFPITCLSAFATEETISAVCNILNSDNTTPKSLRLEACSSEWTAVVNAFVSKLSTSPSLCATLTKLRMPDNKRLSDRQMEGICRFLPNLEGLNIGTFETNTILTHAGAQSLYRNCHKLRYLSINGCFNVPLPAILEIVRSNPELFVCDVSDTKACIANGNADLAAFRSILSMAPKLRLLYTSEVCTQGSPLFNQNPTTIYRKFAALLDQFPNVVFVNSMVGFIQVANPTLKPELVRMQEETMSLIDEMNVSSWQQPFVE